MVSSTTLARIGGSALALGLSAVVIRRRNRIALTDNETATDSEATPFAFSGAPSADPAVAVSVLRRVGQIADVLGLDFGTQITPLMASARPPSFTVRGLHVGREDFKGQPVYAISTDDPSGYVVVALHGGAYVAQPTVNHWLAYAQLARRTHATVIVPIYPLASTPSGRAQTVIPDLGDFISVLIAEHGVDKVSVYGDSAGGGMALAIAQHLVSQNQPTPSRMVLISPWLDVTMTNPAIATIDDPVLRLASLRTAGRQWAGDLPPTDPLVSPLYGSLDHLPTTAVYCGNLDLLAADVLRLQDLTLATEAGAFTFILRNGAIHDWAMGGALSTPEAASVQRNIYEQLGLATPRL